MIFQVPAADSGIGIHFGFDLSRASLDNFVPRMVEMRVKWCVLPHHDEQDLARAVAALKRVDIMPISRWLCRIDDNIIDFAKFVRIFQDQDLPAYIQIFNEPSVSSEWRDGIPKPKAFIARWCDHAARVVNSGGLPGLQVLHVDELTAILNELDARGAGEVVERMWFCPHPYGSNHPPDYPYDPINQHDHPGATLANDDNSVLQFLEFAPVFEQALGFVPPFIAGECGWQYGNGADTRYSKINDAAHAQYHRAIFEWFQSGKLSNGAPLPSYLMACCPWILFGAERDAWYSSTTGIRQQTIDAVKSLQPFRRRNPNLGTLSAESASRPNISQDEKTMSHYVLLGAASHTQWVRLVLLRRYLAHYNVAFGFSLDEAKRAARVTVIGDTAAISILAEQELKRAGCRVERVLGDLYALELIFGDRVARDAEFG